MFRFTTPHEIAALLMVLEGIHQEPRTSRLLEATGISVIPLLGVCLIVWEGLQRGGVSGIALIGSAILIGMFLLTLIIITTYQFVRFSPSAIALQRPFGIGAWSIDPTMIQAIHYRRDSHDSRRLTFVLADGRQRIMMCTRSMQACIEDHGRIMRL